MCYSAQIVQVLRKLDRTLRCALDFDEAEKLFARRLDDPGINISRGFEANFDDPFDARGRRIKDAIDEHRARHAARLEKELFSQKTRLVDAQRALRSKETKKARENVRIATSKIDSLLSKLEDLRRNDTKPRDHRIFPMQYAGVIIERAGQRWLTPMRYACRPAGKPAFYDKKFPGLYNARRDNLEKFWSDQFGCHHALLVVESFYENVQREADGGRNTVLQFTPEPPQPMLIACLWSHWTDPKEPDLRGFAAITDEPPPAVAAAGHDRCIINLQPAHVDAWLDPAARGRDELHSILADRAVSLFQHTALQAA